MSSGHLQELKNNGKSFNFQAQKVVMVAHTKWKSFGVFDSGHLHVWEVVAYGRWTDMEVQL